MVDIQRFTDKYFTRTRQILEAEELNPFVRAQVFVRQGPGTVAGVDEAVQLLKENVDFSKNKGAVYALKNGMKYSPKETQMIIEAPIQDIVELETLYLGIIAGETSKQNDGSFIQGSAIRQRMQDIVDAAGNRPVLYFGARHWGYKEDEIIARAAFEGGAVGASTDAGAEIIGAKGLGTIPHALENIYAWKCGSEHAVLEATRAFDKIISSDIPRIALIDYNNKELDDSLSVVNTLKDISALRVDTCGENLAQGAYRPEQRAQFEQDLGRTLEIPEEDKKYWFGNGVCVSGVYSLRKALDEAGHDKVGLILTSGFGKVEKVQAFARAEKLLERKLFEELALGAFTKAELPQWTSLPSEKTETQ